MSRRAGQDPIENHKRHPERPKQHAVEFGVAQGLAEPPVHRRRDGADDHDGWDPQ